MLVPLTFGERKACRIRSRNLERVCSGFVRTMRRALWGVFMDKKEREGEQLAFGRGGAPLVADLTAFKICTHRQCIT